MQNVTFYHICNDYSLERVSDSEEKGGIVRDIQIMGMNAQRLDNGQLVYVYRNKYGEPVYLSSECNRLDGHIL